MLSPREKEFHWSNCQRNAMQGAMERNLRGQTGAGTLANGFGSVGRMLVMDQLLKALVATDTVAPHLAQIFHRWLEVRPTSCDFSIVA